MDESVVYIHPARTSFKGMLAKGYIKLKGFKKNFIKNVRNRTFKSKPSPLPDSFSKWYNINSSQLNGRNVLTLSPMSGKSGKYILYLHGGGYVNNIEKEHWALIGQLSRQTGASFVVPDYPLAPEVTAETSFLMVKQVYKKLIEKVPPEKVILMGDSAGGGFSLALAQKLREEGLPQPEQIILLSPWLDITMNNPEAAEAEKEDPWLSIEGLRGAGRLWAGEMGGKDPLLSPIYGTMEGLGKISVFIGAKDLLIADARKLKRMMDKQGISFNYFEYPRMFHVWMVITYLKEARLTINQIAELVKK